MLLSVSDRTWHKWQIATYAVAGTEVIMLMLVAAVWLMMGPHF